ncbi:E3 ubiquitin-protein ligase RNF114-like [Sycon ciliatum]|uniref:E3 ubiquitin-protein ligase RNF114-like n=1 Tax=Sycon ciliatum TaxID=27933 RepID=UPI0031F64740
MADDSLGEFECKICLDVLCNPCKLPCNHCFCELCLEGVSRRKGTCPICRSPFVQLQPAAAMRKALMMKHLPCPYCGVKFRADGLRCHKNLCKDDVESPGAGAGAAVMGFAPPRAAAAAAAARPPLLTAATGTGHGPSRRRPGARDTGPNRYTFTCPLCQEGPIDCVELAEHVQERHSGDKRQVVCPVCKVMPWGKPDQVSQNFYDHVTRRHRFEYDRFVDYDMDDDEALKHALEFSMQLQ